MNAHFFIVGNNGQKTGPHDIVTIVKKIRNGSVTVDTLIALDSDGESKPASEWEDLAVFLNEQQEESTQAEAPLKVRTVSFFTRLSSGWHFLQNNMLATVYSGSHVLLMLILTGLIALFVPKAGHIPLYGAVFVLIQYIFSGYEYSVLRMVRGQPVDIAFVREKMQPQKRGLLNASIIMSLFLIIGFLLITSGGQASAIIGLVVVALPGFFTLSLFIFAPLLILDKGMDFWEALELSRKTVLKSGVENIGIIFSLLIINFLAGLLFLIPMIVTLPITLGAISEIYDEYFA